jgi:hypothetical protein
MALIVKYEVWKCDRITTDQTKMHNRSERFESRKKVFEFIDGFNAFIDRKFALYNTVATYVKGEIVEIEEDKYEMIANVFTGREQNRKTGTVKFTVKGFFTTYCRRCGRLLTDPVSVARGIGPECIKKGPIRK